MTKTSSTLRPHGRLCDTVGFGDWKFCDTRPEGSMERAGCDYIGGRLLRGRGAVGPTWYFNGRPCGTDPTQCANHPSEQSMTVGKAAGTYQACVSDSWPVAPGGSRCGTYEYAPQELLGTPKDRRRSGVARRESPTS